MMIEVDLMYLIYGTMLIIGICISYSGNFCILKSLGSKLDYYGGLERFFFGVLFILSPITFPVLGFCCSIAYVGRMFLKLKRK